jgi:hypothetical protein
MNTNQNQNQSTKTTQELKNQVLNDIQRVKDDLEEIKQRATPGQIIDDVLFHRREDRNPAATFEFLKNNPVGTSFLTLGTLLLMEGSDQVSMEEKARTKVKDARTKYGDRISEYQTKAQDLKQVVGDKIDDLRAKAEDVKIKYGETVDKVEGQIDQVKDSISSVGEKNFSMDDEKEILSEGIEATRSKLSSVKDTIAQKGQEAVEKVKHLDPLTYLVLGAGLGTITGGAFPISDTEDRVMSGELQNKFNNFRSELEEALNESANILKNEFIGSATQFNIKIF